MARLRKATLSDVANQAGVSLTTASYILNDRSAEMRIAPETEARVRRAMSRLGYRPNRSARSLRTSTTMTFGLVSDRVAGGNHASRMLVGASAAARDLDHLLVIGETDGDSGAATMLVEEMLDRGVDGVVYATLAHSLVSIPPNLGHHKVVLLNCFDPDRDLPAVLPDEYGGGRAAAGALLQAGIRNDIAIVGERPEQPVRAGDLRVAGITAGLAEASAAPASVIGCTWGVRPAHDAVRRSLATGASWAGLICLNDRIAMGACQALTAAGLRVPDDVSVVSFDGSELAQWLRPAVTSVALPCVELGDRAVRLLADPHAGDRGRVEVAMPLDDGESVRRPAREAAV